MNTFGETLGTGGTDFEVVEVTERPHPRYVVTENGRTLAYTDSRNNALIVMFALGVADYAMKAAADA